MPTPVHSDRPPVAWQDGILLGLTVYFFCGVLVLVAVWLLAAGVANWPLGLHGFYVFLRGTIKIWSSPFPAAGPPLQIAIITLSLQGALPLAASLPIVPAWIAARWISRPGDPIKHIEGRQLSYSVEQAAEEAAEEIRQSGAGLAVHPEIQLSGERETRHLFCVGGTGSGKTVILYPLMRQAIQKLDVKSIIYDNKGDFTAILPNAPGAKKIITLAPWDDRCFAWDVAADVPTRADARTIASRLVPESERDPMWGLAAQSILVGIMVKNQAENPGKSGFSDIVEDVFSGYEHIREIVLKYNPEGIYAVEEAQKTKTTQSFLITLSSFLSQVVDLAEAWKGRPRFSLRRWLLDPDSQENRTKACKYIVLQGNKRFLKLEQAYIQSLVAAPGIHSQQPRARGR